MGSRGDLRVRDYVVNEKQPAWGPGVVVGVEGQNAWVIFRDLSGRAAVRMRATFLEPAGIDSEPILDNLPPVKREGADWVLPAERVSMQEAMARFLESYPRAFEDPAYLRNERDYKLRAHEDLSAAVRGPPGRDPGALGREVQRVLRGVGLLSQFEMMALSDALRVAPDAFAAWVERAVDAAGAEPGAARFEPLAAAVVGLPAEEGKARIETWPVVTVLPYLLAPDRHMVLKPDSSRRAADRLGFDLHYTSRPGWPVYARLLEMGRLYLERLAPHGARDLIDVQSYFWHTGSYDDWAARRRASEGG